MTGARDPVSATVMRQSPWARDRPQGSVNPSDFEREYYSLFCLPPARLFKFILTQFGDSEVANMIVQRDPTLLFDIFISNLGQYTRDTWSDLFNSADVDSTIG